MSRKYSLELSQKTRKIIQNSIQQTLLDNSYIAPESERLLDLGVPDYRQYTISEHNTVLYRVDEAQQQIVLLLVFDTRQSLEKLLTDISLML